MVLGPGKRDTNAHKTNPWPERVNQETGVYTDHYMNTTDHVENGTETRGTVRGRLWRGLGRRMCQSPGGTFSWAGRVCVEHCSGKIPGYLAGRGYRYGATGVK